MVLVNKTKLLITGSIYESFISSSIHPYIQLQQNKIIAREKEHCHSNYVFSRCQWYFKAKMTSEEKRRTNYQNGHGKWDQSTALFFVDLDAFFFFFSLTGFGIATDLSNCTKIELWIISFHIYGNDSVWKIAQSNFNRILNLFGTFNNICAEHYIWQNAQTFGEKIPGCCFWDEKREFLFAQLPANRVATCSCLFSRHVQCTVVWTISHVSLHIFEFYVSDRSHRILQNANTIICSC